MAKGELTGRRKASSSPAWERSSASGTKCCRWAATAAVRVALPRPPATVMVSVYPRPKRACKGGEKGKGWGGCEAMGVRLADAGARGWQRNK